MLKYILCGSQNKKKKTKKEKEKKKETDYSSQVHN